MNELYPTKGTVDGVNGKVTFSAWDVVSVCTGESCCLYGRCPYTATKKKAQLTLGRQLEDRGGALPVKCRLEADYLDTIIEPVMGLMADKEFRETDRLDFGMKYIPLYQDLIRVKKELIALELLTVGTKVGIQVTPLLREKREIIRAIEGLAFTKRLREMFAMKGVKKVSSKDVEEFLEGGDPGHVEALRGK